MAALLDRRDFTVIFAEKPLALGGFR